MKEQLFGTTITRDADELRERMKPRPVHMVPTIAHRPPSSKPEKRLILARATDGLCPVLLTLGVIAAFVIGVAAGMSL